MHRVSTNIVPLVFLFGCGVWLGGGFFERPWESRCVWRNAGLLSHWEQIHINSFFFRDLCQGILRRPQQESLPWLSQSFSQYTSTDQIISEGIVVLLKLFFNSSFFSKCFQFLCFKFVLWAVA